MNCVLRILFVLALAFPLLLPAVKAAAFQKGDWVEIPFRCTEAFEAFRIAHIASLVSPDVGSLFLSKSIRIRKCVASPEPYPLFILAKQEQEFGVAGTQRGFVWGVAREEKGQIVGYIGLLDRTVSQ